MHESHMIQNIVGVLNIVDEQGIIRETKIPAGYCAECNIFFVLESIYRDLRAKGNIMCRISDDMYSIKNDYFYGGKIAKERFCKSGIRQRGNCGSIYEGVQ